MERDAKANAGEEFGMASRDGTNETGTESEARIGAAIPPQGARARDGGSDGGAPHADGNPWTEEQRDGLRLACDTLGTLFLREPCDPQCVPVIRALAELDCDAAAEQWPFVGDAGSDAVGHARESLERLARGARDEAVARDEEVPPAGDGAGDGGEQAHHARLTPLLESYRRLMEGPGRLQAPPWGSVYTDRDGVTFGLSTLALHAWMRAHGIAMDVGERVPEDHIGLMLGQASMLCQKRPELLDQFLGEHLLTWSHHYLDKLSRAASARAGGARSGQGGDDRAEHEADAFYQGLADLTDLTLEGVRARRGIEVSYPRFYR
ncbi:MAG: molecular chaperone TorD family protein [Coriobacteriales bacterium]|jgi:TorA maturation chaperone TorD